MNDTPEGEKKIIVDEDWKTRVEAEREAQKHAPPPDESPDADGVVYQDYRTSQAEHPGSIFAIAVTEDDLVDAFPAFARRDGGLIKAIVDLP